MAKKPHPSADSEMASPQAVAKRENIKSPEFFSIYANDVQVQTTPWDMHLTLGTIDSVTRSDQPVAQIQQMGELRISVQLAKILTKIMADQLQAYEQRFGAIPELPAQ
jgi:hypothetical protein